MSTSGKSIHRHLETDRCVMKDRGDMTMMKRLTITLAIVLGAAVFLQACGEKSQESVMKRMDKQLQEMKGYKTKAEMRMNTGKEEQVYQIEVWHKKDDFYRVALSNQEDEKNNQVILKNEDGVFVVTPALDKSFKFQSEWPENSSQSYLYQSLLNDIQQDKESNFQVTDTHYLFTTKTNYQSNNNLPYQEIYVDKKTYTPVLVKVLDTDQKPVVEVKFEQFQLNPEFNEKDFALDDHPQTDEDKAENTGEKTEQVFSIMYPEFTAGAELQEEKELTIENGTRLIMTYDGEKAFTLVQEHKETVPSSAGFTEVSGEMIDLGHSIGAISNSMIEWNYNGADFYLASDQLTREELIEVAKSVVQQEVK